MRRPLPLLPLVLLVALATPLRAQAQQPSFDCAKAKGQVQQLICRDADLAALDRRLADVYATAMKTLPADEVGTQRTVQRGWIKGRDECWKATDVHDCVAYAYRTRTVELQIMSGQFEVPTPASYTCKGHERTPFTAVFYRESDPPSAVLTFGDDQVVAFVARSGSGARYVAPNVEFWEHQGEVSLNWYDTTYTCAVQR